MKTTKGRGKSPSQKTILALWTASGGRCQFEGCNCKVFRDDITGEEFNAANVAHIIASSENGPRGSIASGNLSDNVENLMLLCPVHHKEIDTFVERYSVSYLLEMKQRQERKVQELLDCMYYPEAEIVVLESPIKGQIPVHVDSKQAIDALRSIKKNPASSYPVVLKACGIGDYKSSDYWSSLTNSLKDSARQNLLGRMEYKPELMLGIFPLAPIPLITKFGELLGDKKNVDVFQKTREPDTWCWTNSGITNDFKVSKTIREESTEENEIAIILSLTASVAEERVLDAVDAAAIYHIRAERTGVDCISSTEDLKAFWQQYQIVCDRIKNEDLSNRASVFPAVPVSAAFEIGRRHMAGAHPALDIYEEYNGFFKAVTIGGSNT